MVGNECGFAGHQDWRLPNVKELFSILDYANLGPAASIPGTGTGFYWSATTVTFNSANAWIVFFNLGWVDNFDKTTSQHVRAVRGDS